MTPEPEASSSAPAGGPGWVFWLDLALLALVVLLVLRDRTRRGAGLRSDLVVTGQSPSSETVPLVDRPEASPAIAPSTAELVSADV